MSAVAVRDIVMPQLGMGMSEGTIKEWFVEEGSRVARDAPLVSIETEKVVTELPAPYAGFVHIIGTVGDTLPIETVIATIAATEQGYEAARAGDAAAEPIALKTGENAAATPDNADETAAPVRRFASGLAKSLARLHAVNLFDLTGSGPRGRIVKADVLAAVAASRDAEATAAATDPSTSSPAGPLWPDAPATAVRSASVDAAPVAGDRRVRQAIPMHGARRTIADRMVRSSSEAAQTFVFFEVDVTELLQTRQRMDARRGEGESRISALAYYAKAVALACQRVPIANATLEDDRILLWEEVNIGIAVAMPGSTEDDSSLIVPVIRDADRLGVDGLNRAIRGQVQKVRDGTATAADFAGGTITISSNAGFFPGMWVYTTPLLNMPQAIIFQPGNATKRPVVVNDEIVIRTILPCSLTFDHRILDGEPTARFVRELSGFLSCPETMIL